MTDGVKSGVKAILWQEKKFDAFNYIEELEKENEELKKDKEYLDKVNNEQTEMILKLNEQIEKMKCCGNCKYIFICKKSDKSGMGSYPYNCKDWELAE